MGGSYYSDYSDDDDYDVRIRTSGRQASTPYTYVEAPRRPVSYVATDRRPDAYLVPERTVVRARSRSRERFRRPDPPTSPPAPAAHPVIINNNRFYHEPSDEEDDYRQLQVARPRQRSHSRAGPATDLISRQEFEAEQMRRELEEIKLNKSRDEDERRALKQCQDEGELRRIKQELDKIRAQEEREKEERRAQKQSQEEAELRHAKQILEQRRAQEEREKEEARIKEELELKRLKEEERQKELKKQREKEAQAAIERYKQQERERVAREEKEKEEREKEYQRRLQEDLIQSGLDEKHIAAILKKEKIPEKPAPTPPAEATRPTYTRMARKHLSIETLRTFHIEYELDIDPEYVLIKRWVPDWEQDTLWKHTRGVREKRSSRLLLEVGDKRSGREDPKFEWVRKKSDRKRSKSPALLMYLAGARPA
ncbi:hypothetical protein SODALDRAFT_335257 [Sodiomyces alkalinus F11]|uniref:Uncharacterized protein n=1 Tax=Sodiomyces alkalinus (strain CBS 110278 / VKM F-3762 / F11) TaxID=1314773 RepID=A0A3N2PRD9_SODAK|nr:hypothetical protein SODALDRAFT_335257 [Sodiomyces alkalinus F11]ROT37040.1 hypothetical protein SODALDRAFT_335257 [Sodiomyces alkalinus F11]